MLCSYHSSLDLPLQTLLVRPGTVESESPDMETSYYRQFLMNSLRAVDKMKESHNIPICSEIGDKQNNFQSFFKV